MSFSALIDGLSTSPARSWRRRRAFARAAGCIKSPRLRPLNGPLNGSFKFSVTHPACYVLWVELHRLATFAFPATPAFPWPDSSPQVVRSAMQVPTFQPFGCVVVAEYSAQRRNHLRATLAQSVENVVMCAEPVTAPAAMRMARPHVTIVVRVTFGVQFTPAPITGWANPQLPVSHCCVHC